MAARTDPIFGETARAIVNRTFVASIETHAQLASTNDRALQRAAEPDVALPCLVIAEHQTQGRGRGRNRWWSSAGSLTCSLVLDPAAHRLPLSRWPEMSLTVGVSICEAIAALLPGEDVRLKWPNDVYLRGAKVAGVLVEVPAQVSGRVVIGIGLNVSNRVDAESLELRQTAISLADAGSCHTPADVLIAVLNSLKEQLDALGSDPEVVRHRWREYDLLRGRTLTIADGVNTWTGVSLGIADDAALLLETPNGLRRCYAGAVQAFA